MPPLNAPERQWRGRVEDAERMAQHFPSLAGALARPETRRHVLRLMAASMALGGLAGCDDPSHADGQYVPAVNQAADIIPGVPNHYATALLDGGTAAGMVVRHDMGRPVKIEGNPAHPASLGATSIHGQALLLDFYDPDRASGVLEAGDVTTWQSFLRAIGTQREHLAATEGAGLRILTGRVVSPTYGAAIRSVMKRYPKAKWVQWDPIGRDSASLGLAAAYGRPLDLLPHVAAADVILALDSDLLSGAPGHLRHARDFASRRNPVRSRMSRVYAAEPIPTLIGTAADHRFIAGPHALHAAVNALAATILGSATPGDAPPWVEAVAADLRTAGPHALVHAGPSLPADAQALVHQINERLGARGTTFDLIEPVAVQPGGEADAAALLADMAAGVVDTLLILDCNPVYAQPGFAAALPRVGFSVSSAPSPDETAHAVHWHVPMAHLFETWGDARAHDGTVTIQQPMALPLYDGHSPLELLALFEDGASVRSRDRVRATWRDHLDDTAWDDALAAGLVPSTASAYADAKPLAPAPLAAAPAATLTLQIRPDPNLLDGRHANNPWLQELPRPIGKVVWDNPLLVAPVTAAQARLENGDEVTLELAGVQVTMPVWIVPGQSPDVVIAWRGGGRTRAGAVGNGVGTDVTSLLGLVGTPSLRKTGKRVEIASTDHHNMLEVDRETIDQIVRHGTLAAFAADPTFLRKTADKAEIYHLAQSEGVAWGMSVDLNACIGCNACVIACQAENNVPVVGREQVLMGREMHWLRIDCYYEGPAEDPASLLQPMLCMHCEDAPCEPVCPVEASIHDSEGLNLQVYNRCIGTRFCSNNCPYKVRRFNFGAWAAEEARPPISRNPDVSVRARGVMEKCTFCVQRIAEARIAHDRDGAPERAVTACQAVCPTQAFSFGDINDRDSDVAKRKQSPLDYALLADQNTHPRVTYEARIANRNEALGA